ncbi:MAG: universal stress protein A [Candidatus Kapaibacterium sp.]|nr:MAG: universal stress protein A [Candidatus Kapabacteria bacterium]
MSWTVLALAVDASLPSLHAAKVAGELGRALGAEVALIAVVDRTKAVGDIDAGIGIEESMMVLRKEAEQALSQAKEALGMAAVRTLLIEGDPKHDILRAAEHVGASAIIVGTHGRKGIARLIEGSVAAFIIRHSTVPVVVVPQPQG